VLHSCWCILLIECGLNSNFYLNSNLFELEIAKIRNRKENQTQYEAQSSPLGPKPSLHSIRPSNPLSPIPFARPVPTPSAHPARGPVPSSRSLPAQLSARAPSAQRAIASPPHARPVPLPRRARLSAPIFPRAASSAQPLSR
jgi:hypothetical protein